MTLSSTDQERQNARRRRAWDRQADRYDRQIGWWERRLFGQEHRPWTGQHVTGDVLEVAIGTGLNIPHYTKDVKVTGIDLSRAMLDIARQRAADLDRDVELCEGDAHNLSFDDGSFDTVVCTFSLCNIPDIHQAVGEMHRVLRPGGRLVLVDHIASSVAPIRWFQKGLEQITVRVDGDYLTRRPAAVIERHGFDITERERSRWGIVERLVAVNR